MIRIMIEVAVVLVVVTVFSTLLALAKPRVVDYAGVTCQQVKYYYAALGGLEGIKAYAAANNITISPARKRQALACLRS